MSEHGRDCNCFPCRRDRARLADLEWAESRGDPTARLPSPREEARALLALVQGRNGGTEKAIAEVRALIAVPPRVRGALRAYCWKHPEARRGISKILKFRLLVAAEFEELLSAGGPELGFDLGGAGLQVVEPHTEGFQTGRIEEGADAACAHTGDFILDGDNLPAEAGEAETKGAAAGGRGEIACQLVH